MKQTPYTLAREVADAPKETVFLGSGRFMMKWLFIGVGLVMPFIWATLLVLAMGSPLSMLIVVIAAYLSTMFTVILPLTFFLKWMYRVRTTHTGIHGGTIWGTPVYLKWSEMETVEPRSIIGLPYLRVKSFRENCPTLWLPRFLAKPDAFKQYVAEHTAPTNPLRRSLENGYTPEKREPLPH